VALNFGATPFRFDPPPGFVGLANAPPSSIVSGTFVDTQVARAQLTAMQRRLWSLHHAQSAFAK